MYYFSFLIVNDRFRQNMQNLYDNINKGNLYGYKYKKL